MSATPQNKALRKGDLVLITGASGWLGSHIAETALEHGLRVRLTSRSEEKIQPLVDALSSRFGKSNIEVSIVRDFAQDGAYDEAIKGVDGVVHPASDTSFSDNPDEVVKPVLKGYATLLAACKSTSSVKRVVLTSSSVACCFPHVNGKETQRVDSTTWNTQAKELVKTDPKSFVNYAASKVLSEEYAWRYIKENQVNFVLNVINPNFIMGAKVQGYRFESTGSWIRDAIIGNDWTLPNMLGPQHHIDVNDTSLLHVLALTREDIVSERILAFADRFSWSDVIDLMKEVRPDLPPREKNDLTDRVDNTLVDVTRTKEILKEYGGLKSLKQSLQGNFAKEDD